MLISFVISFFPGRREWEEVQKKIQLLKDSVDDVALELAKAVHEKKPANVIEGLNKVLDYTEQLLAFYKQRAKAMRGMQDGLYVLLVCPNSLLL